jgi:hypothetical protein
MRFALQLRRSPLPQSFMKTSGTSRITTQCMTEKRFVFHVPFLNTYHIFKATTRAEAQHQFINSHVAPYYGQAVLLNPDD